MTIALVSSKISTVANISDFQVFEIYCISYVAAVHSSNFKYVLTTSMYSPGYLIGKFEFHCNVIIIFTTVEFAYRVLVP